MSVVITLDDNERTKCEVWVRCMGYFRMRSDLNIGKKQESLERKNYIEEIALKSLEAA